MLIHGGLKTKSHGFTLRVGALLFVGMLGCAHGETATPQSGPTAQAAVFVPSAHPITSSEATPDPEATSSCAQLVPLSPGRRTVVIESEPSGAEVWSLGHCIGYTPLELPVPEGDERTPFEIRAAGFEMQQFALLPTSFGVAYTFSLQQTDASGR